MAAPALTSTQNRGNRCQVFAYSQSGANDGNVDIEVVRPLASLSFHLTGTYVAGSLTINCSNNGTTFVALPTTAKTISALGMLVVAPGDLAFRYYRAAFASMDAGNTLVLTTVAKYLQ